MEAVRRVKTARMFIQRCAENPLTLESARTLERCHHGYHVKGTKVESQNVRNENVRDVRNEFSSSSLSPVGGEVRSFLEVLVRKELQSLFSPMQRQPNQFTVMDWLTKSAV